MNAIFEPFDQLSLEEQRVILAELKNRRKRSEMALLRLIIHPRHYDTLDEERVLELAYANYDAAFQAQTYFRNELEHIADWIQKKTNLTRWRADNWPLHIEFEIMNEDTAEEEGIDIFSAAHPRTDVHQFVYLHLFLAHEAEHDSLSVDYWAQFPTPYTTKLGEVRTPITEDHVNMLPKLVQHELMTSSWNWVKAQLMEQSSIQLDRQSKRLVEDLQWHLDSAVGYEIKDERLITLWLTAEELAHVKNLGEPLVVVHKYKEWTEMRGLLWNGHTDIAVTIDEGLADKNSRNNPSVAITFHPKVQAVLNVAERAVLD